MSQRGAGKDRGPERWLERSWGYLEHRLRLTSASVIAALVWAGAGLAERDLARSRVSGDAQKARTPERWPERSWGILKQLLDLTSASVNDKLCTCVGGCAARRERPGQLQGGLRMRREGKSSGTVA